MTAGLSALVSETLADQAYTRIRTAIGEGELAPGQRITERGLAEALQVSPTPVREAIRRLEQDSLVERVGPRTLRIAALSDTSAAELVEAEAALRGVVARFAARNITAQQLEDLETLLRAADKHIAALEDAQLEPGALRARATDLLLAMRSFNALVERACGNPVLERLLDQARAFTPTEKIDITLDRMLAGSFRGRQRYSYHRELVSALRSHDADRTEELTLAHAAAVGRELTAR